MPAQHTPPRYWTEEEFYAARDAAPPGERWELVDGEVLVTPSPHWTHQGVVLQLAVRLESYVRAQQLGMIFTSPLDVKLQPGCAGHPGAPRPHRRTGEPIRGTTRAREPARRAAGARAPFP